MKRLFDIFFSLFFVIILSPIFFLVVLFVVIDTGFPFLFVQKRVGKNGQIFKMFKFRTMTINKEAKQGTFDVGDVRRVTTVGKILRKTKLDELPQLFNVLFGSMSFVGPRPEVQKWVDIYPERWAFVHTVKPGITDNASIVFRNEEEILAASDEPIICYKNEILPRKLELYEEYIRKNSFWGDILIIIRTFSSVLFK